MTTTAVSSSPLLTCHPCSPSSSYNKRIHNDAMFDMRLEDTTSTFPPQKRQRTQYRRVACRARNMPPDHDEDSAYFEIPIDAPHGILLGCSHPSCGNDKKRFRYCVVCQIPVSKRNFAKRHSHGLPMGSTMGSKPTGLESTTSVVNIPSRSLGTDLGCNDCLSTDEESRCVEEVSSASSTSQPLTEQERRWLQLLYNCPKVDSVQDFKQWIQHIVQCADVGRKEDDCASMKHDALTTPDEPSQDECIYTDAAFSSQDVLSAIEIESIKEAFTADEIYEFEVGDGFLL
mmetsp:Transcript_18447/g.31490  ORF Transcript_18447/g.31490 Transcript_18447/m.31490 type:complete len:287 (-) Transcript_18447:530-1390(-)